MAQVMGPPLSPRETRRSSGRRSGPPLSNSHSPESDIGPRFKEGSRPPLLSSNSSGSNNGRNKLEPPDDSAEDRKATVQSASASSSNSTQGSTKSKRKPKEKELESDPPQPAVLAAEMVTTDGPAAEEEEEQGITRCICGSTGEDDPDAGEFMVQCETCQVWQHGLCMGFDSEDQLHDGDYYCEQCRPDMHVELLKKLARRPRHSSTTSHHTAGANSRLSRSHSPHLKQPPSKRRNTMNSRDAAFDENLKQILETTAIEAGEDPATAALILNDQATTGSIEFDELADPPTNRTANTNHKKRKRVENNNVNVNDLSTTKKRTRSMSATSDHPPTLNVNEEVSVFLPPPPPPAAVAAKSSGRNKRGGRKTAVIQDTQIDAGGDAQQPVPPKRSANSHRKGASRANARPPQSNVGGGAQAQNSISHDPRRVQGNNNPNGAQTSAADSRAYRNSHAYAVSQQPLWTSWHLPDYLSHLEEILPTNVPMPLEVVSGALLAGSGGRESVERTVERGVKVKWPSKRTSVADMNKRVRALVEWVGREQASALDRARRREALENALRENASSSVSAETQQPTSMKDMEELMEELISFQERFGPGARRERRAAAAAAAAS